jgi:hypothetical protein
MLRQKTREKLQARKSAVLAWRKSANWFFITLVSFVVEFTDEQDICTTPCSSGSGSSFTVRYCCRNLNLQICSIRSYRQKFRNLFFRASIGLSRYYKNRISGFDLQYPESESLITIFGLEREMQVAS